MLVKLDYNLKEPPVDPSTQTLDLPYEPAYELVVAHSFSLQLRASHSTLFFSYGFQWVAAVGVGEGISVAFGLFSPPPTPIFLFLSWFAANNIEGLPSSPSFVGSFIFPPLHLRPWPHQIYRLNFDGSIVTAAARCCWCRCCFFFFFVFMLCSTLFLFVQ